MPKIIVPTIKSPTFSSSAQVSVKPLSHAFPMIMAQISTILHNLHNFRTILLSRQWVAFLKIKQIQAQKDGFPHFCTICFPICARKKSPTQTSEKHFVVPYWNSPSISFDGAINGINVLINWKKLPSPKAIRLKPRKTAFPLMASYAKTIDGTQNPLPNLPNYPTLCLRTNRSMKGQWGQWQMQSPTNRFNQKQPASTPETRFFSIDRQCQKPLTPQKNLIPQPD
jgi:hypothetical protein